MGKTDGKKHWVPDGHDWIDLNELDPNELEELRKAAKFKELEEERDIYREFIKESFYLCSDGTVKYSFREDTEHDEEWLIDLFVDEEKRL